jgi:hypothetical protein
MNDDNPRVIRAIEAARKRCPELAKIELVRPRSNPLAIERLDAYTLAYDPALVATLNASELIAAVEKAANDWTFTPEAPELLDVTAQRDALKALVEAMIADIDPFYDAVIDDWREKLAAIVGKR